MRTTVPDGGGEIEAILEGEMWRVRLGGLEESSRYLDALSQLLDAEASAVHTLATRLVQGLLLESEPQTVAAARP